MKVRRFTPLPSGVVLSHRYKILVLIRQGGMGATYRATDLQTGKVVVVKQFLDLFKTAEEREDGIANFIAEMGVLKSIAHPCIPKLQDHFVDFHGFFFVLEFIEGSDFSSLLEETGRYGLPESDVARTGILVCRMLRYLHHLKPSPIIHRDIKPSNIMKRSTGEILLVDFGIARAAKPKEGMMIGTLGYAPPEQHHNQADARSDIYSLGAALHELATGQRPDESTFSFVPPHELRPELSVGFSQTILTAVNYSPGDRFQDANFFEDALAKLLDKPVSDLAVDPFTLASSRFQKEFLSPALREAQKRYPNECQTGQIPAHFDSLIFTLGIQVPYSLIITVVPERQSMTFHLKEGLLTPKLLGEVSPLQPQANNEAGKLLKEYFTLYESSSGISPQGRGNP